MESGNAPLTYGMVGGGKGSMIGDTHRIGARIDGRFRLAAGALDVVPERGQAFARELGIEAARAYPDWRTMLEAERARPDPVDLVTIATHNTSHHGIARAFLDAGFNVLCEKPLTTSVEDAVDLVRATRRAGTTCAVMYAYTGYPLVREMRAICRDGGIGRIRVIQAEFAHGGHAAADPDSTHAGWRYDPSKVGPSSVLADAGSHALHMMSWVTGLEAEEVSARFDSFVAGRTLEDNAHLTLAFEQGAVGTLWASGVAVGHAHGLRLRVYGETGSLAWSQEDPNVLLHARLGEPLRILERGWGELHALSRVGERVSRGHAEGLLTAFANIYRDLAGLIAARRQGQPPDPLVMTVPDVVEGARGVATILAAVASSKDRGAWTSCRLPEA
ncbi:MAG: Gfo/Idh/MocA family oxidoreductase [Geminicoccaceae bacterium]